MALTLGDNFSYQGAKPLDGRLVYDTLANMKAVADATMYNGCLAYCVATDKTYQWKSTNTVDADTGRWREFETGGGEDTNAYHVSDAAETSIDDADYFPFYDTSATARKKSLWSNIKSVLKTYFDTLYSTVRTKGTPTSGGTDLSLVTTGDLYAWDNKANAPTVLSQTLSAGSTSVTFSNVPTTGNFLITPFTSVVGLDYDSISQSGSTVTVIYSAQSSAVTVFLKIEEV